MEDCGRDACGSRVFHPHLPGAVVVKRGAEEKSFATVFGECSLTLWLVADEGFHADGDKGSGVLVVWDVHVGVGGNFGVCFRLGYKQQLALVLGNQLTPEVLGKGCHSTT